MLGSRSQRLKKHNILNEINTWGSEKKDYSEYCTELTVYILCVWHAHKLIHRNRGLPPIESNAMILCKSLALRISNLIAQWSVGVVVCERDFASYKRAINCCRETTNPGCHGDHGEAEEIALANNRLLVFEWHIGGHVVSNWLPLE